VVTEAQARLTDLKADIADPTKVPERAIADIENSILRLTERVERTEEIISERVGEAAEKDSDNDGITDFDEISLYNTDPFSADSDNDGFTDEAEILGGFDPNNPSQEAAIVYESPKEAGVIREDVFEIEGIVTSGEPEEQSGESTATSTQQPTTTAAVLVGRALPNSFVTLYIFSTPVIVTVRTNDDGTWSYRFDKELEDGEHQVYVGVTDNAGKIVAKSNPFTFVKEAQAFTPVDAQAAALSAEPPEPTLFSNSGIAIALSAVVISLGFVLLMLSAYMSRRQAHQLGNVVHVG